MEAGFERLAGFRIGGHLPNADFDDAFLVASVPLIADGLGGREPAGPRHDPGGLLLAGAEPRFASELEREHPGGQGREGGDGEGETRRRGAGGQRRGAGGEGDAEDGKPGLVMAIFHSGQAVEIGVFLGKQTPFRLAFRVFRIFR